MSVTCLNIIQKMNKSVDNANTALIDNMTESTMIYEWVCIKPNLTYHFFYNYLKNEWEEILNNFINQPNNCASKLSEFLEIYKYSPDKIAQIRQILQNLNVDDDSGLTKTNLSSVNIENIVLDTIATSLLDSNDKTIFELKTNFIETMQDLGSIMIEKCRCQLVDIFKMIVRKYKKKYSKKFQDRTKDEVIEILRDDYNEFKKMLINFNSTGNIPNQSEFLNKIANKFTSIYGFTIESELDKLIPKELGSLKYFFITVIRKYYNNLHPIIWAQIFKNITENIFIDLPFTTDEIFSFVSKYLLLNSGPFILKILQMIRPVLSPELAIKYNLTKLTYPVLKPNQIEIILQKVVYNWDMYEILENFSASVGHVCKVVRVDNPDNVFMIKIIKPVAVAQSCWEYHTLYDVYPQGSCEHAFIKNMLESNGRELNVNNEINNINKGFINYTATYNKVFGYDVDAKLESIQNIPNIIVPNTWFALSMTLAPGIPLSKLVENDLITTDTIYRAKLHRCLDLLVYKFFLNIVKNGFYHVDLHSGNVFYSYDNSQMTLIDFGAVSEIDIYSNDPSIKTLLDIIVMSMFYNYNDIFDTMTILLNSKCEETKIDSNTPEYAQLREKLIEYKVQNILNQEIERERSKKYINDIFSEQRINAEKAGNESAKQKNTIGINGSTIYSYLEHQPKGKEIIIENRDELPSYTNIEEGTDVGFVGVLEEIIKFYALSGINIAIKFNEFYEFQKAYALLLGILHKVHYNSYRTSYALEKAVKNWKNISQLMHISTIAHFVKTYSREKNKFNDFKQKMNIQSYPTRNMNKNTSSIKNINRHGYKSINPVTIKDNKECDIDTEIESGNIYVDEKNYIKYLKYKAKIHKLLSK